MLCCATHRAMLCLFTFRNMNGQYTSGHAGRQCMVCMQAHARYSAGTNALNGAFGSFVSGAAPQSATTNTKTLHTISEARPAYPRVRTESYYAETSSSTSAAPRATVGFSSKRMSTEAFYAAAAPLAATARTHGAQHEPHPSGVLNAPTATSTGALVHSATDPSAADGTQGLPHRPSVAAAVTAALVASAMAASSAKTSTPGGASGGYSQHSTPAVEGPQHVYDSESSSMAGASSGIAPGQMAGAATERSGSGGHGRDGGGSSTSGMTRSGTAGATYDPASDARKEQRMVELAALLARGHRRGDGAEQPSTGAARVSLSKLPSPAGQARANPMSPEPVGTVVGLHREVEESLYRNIDIPKPTSSSYEERSMERSVDSAFRVRATPPPVLPCRAS